MSKPVAGSAPLRWATLPLIPADVTQPDTTHKDNGWQNAEEPPHSYFNYWMNLVYLWAVYLDNITAEALTWTAVETFQVGIVVTQSTVNGHAVNGTGNGTGSGGFFTGGASSGPGVTSTGGAANGAGGGFFGTGTGLGLLAVGGNGGGSGLQAQGGVGSGWGAKGIGGSTGGDGVIGVGTAGDANGGSFTGIGFGNGAKGTAGGSAGAAGVLGQSSALAGTTYGVLGVSLSANGSAIGVYGNGGTLGTSIGVQGRGGAHGGIGGNFIGGSDGTTGGEGVVSTGGANTGGFAAAFHGIHGGLTLDDGKITATGNATPHVLGDTEINGALDVDFALSVGTDVLIGGNAFVSGNETISGALTVGSIVANAVTAPTFTNSWANAGSTNVPAGYWKDKEGKVFIRGDVTGGSSISSAFTLPAAFRPAYDHVFPGPSDAAGHDCSIIIFASTGQVQISYSVGFAGPISLCGICFRTD